MKLLVTLCALIASLIFHSNNDLMAEKINGKLFDDNRYEVKSKREKPIGNGSRKWKLSKQLAEAKKKCWDGNYIFTRIVNGTEAENNTLPWMVAIFFVEDNNSTKLICGGAIVSATFVLSAAHCFSDNNELSSKLAGYFVRYGVHDLNAKDFVERKVREVQLHPKFKDGRNDIAIVRLSHRVTYNDLVRPICVPRLTTPSFWDQWALGDPVLLSGWGSNVSLRASNRKKPHMLLKGYGYIVNHSVCASVDTQFDHSSNLCVGSKAEESKLCHGDSGSPVVPAVFLLKNESFVFPVVIGIVSFGEPRCRGPDVLTKVENFSSWISKVTFKW